MINTLQMIAAPSGGGAESFFVRLALGLNTSDWANVSVLTRRDPDRDAQFAQAGIPVYHGVFSAPSIDCITPWQARRALAAIQPDVVMTWMNRATALLPHPKKRRFVHVARLGDYYNLKYYKNCDYLVGNTTMVVDYLLRGGWPLSKVRYIPNFVEPPMLAAHKFEIDGPIILGVGRLHPTKGFDILIRALKHVPRGHLMLVGDGPLKEELQSLVQALGLGHRVTFLGWRYDVAALMQGADVFVIPSRHEPLGNVILEAWAARVPVVAMAADGPRLLIEEGVSGRLTSMENVEAMAAALNDVVESKAAAQSLVEGGWATYQRLYSPATVLAQYKDFYSHIVG